MLSVFGAAYARVVVRHLPQWMPGASFLRIADQFKALEHKASWSPYLWCKQRVVCT